MPKKRAVMSKEPCMLSEYRGNYLNAKTQRDPINKPKDMLKPDGEVDYDTMNKKHFTTHKLEPKQKQNNGAKYVKQMDPMELDTEYGDKYVKGKGETASMPGYFKEKTQLYDGGNENVDKSVTQNDFDRKTYRKPTVYSYKDNYIPSDAPFNSKSTHQADYMRFQQTPLKNSRRPDNIDNKGL